MYQAQVQRLGDKFNKRKLVYEIIKDWASKNKSSFEELQKVFPDEIQGTKGFIIKESEVKDPKRFNMKEPLSIKNGLHVVVSNQWGENIADFIVASEKLGYTVTANSGENGYLNYFKKQEFSNQSEFIENTNKLFTGFSWESEKDCDEVKDLHNQLNEITQSDVTRYGV